MTRDAGPSGERCNEPGGAICPTERPGAFGRRRRRSSLEVSGTTTQLAPNRRTKIAAVKSVDIKDRWYDCPPPGVDRAKAAPRPRGEGRHGQARSRTIDDGLTLFAGRAGALS